MNDLYKWKYKPVRFDVINITPSVTTGHQGSQILFVPLVKVGIFSANIANLKPVCSK